MKQHFFLTTFTFFLMIGAVSAQQIPVRGLKSVMKDLGASYKTLGSQINDVTKNAESILILHKIEELVQEAEALRPDIIATLPPAQQGPEQAKYVQMIQQLHKDAVDVENALSANNQAAAIAVMKKMSQDKADGHSEFKP